MTETECTDRTCEAHGELVRLRQMRTTIENMVEINPRAVSIDTLDSIVKRSYRA